MKNINEENTQVQRIDMTEEEFAELSKKLDLEIDDIESNSNDLTYFQEPIFIEEEIMSKNEKFIDGLEESMKLGGIFTGMVNAGFSRELAEQYAVESVLLDKKLELAKLEQDKKSLELELQSI